jgi:hypothetical protein
VDELALLKQFRLDDAAADGAREHARRALASAMARHRVRRRYALALALLGAAVLAGGAYAIAHELIVGDPAPAEVTEQLARFGQEADLIPYERPDAPETKGLRVVAVLDSSAGRAYLFGDQAGRCAHTWIEGDRGYQGRLNMSGVCGSETEGFWAFGRRPVGEQVVGLLSGHAGDGVSRITVRVDGRELTVPLADRWFFAELAEDPTALVTYDAAGNVVREYQIPLRRRGDVRPLPPPQRHQVGESRELLRIHARRGSETVTLEVARSSDGGNCMIVRSDKTRTNRSCAVPTPKASEIGVVAMQYGGAPTGIQLLVGPVGVRIERLTVRYQDGRVNEVPLNEGWALYEIVRADYEVGRRPVELVGLDGAGEVVASERLPWG